VWNFAFGVEFGFSTDQLSPAGIDSSRTCSRLCKRDFVFQKYPTFHKMACFVAFSAGYPAIYRSAWLHGMKQIVTT